MINGAKTTLRQIHPQGFTLLETLAALLILSIGLLGLASLQLTNVKNSRDAYYRTQANILAQDIAERMRANREGIEENAYHATDGAQNANCRQLTGCTWSQLAADDVYLWHTSVESVLPSGEARVCKDSSPNDGTNASSAECDNNGDNYAAKIWWDDDRNPTTPLQRFSLPFSP